MNVLSGTITIKGELNTLIDVPCEIKETNENKIIEFIEPYKKNKLIKMTLDEIHEQKWFCNFQCANNDKTIIEVNI